MSRTRIQRVQYGTVRVGDRIKVTGAFGDMDITREGTVHRIVSTPSSWEYVTRQGYTLLKVNRVPPHDPPSAVIDLLQRNADTPLFDF